ncbi:acid protease [Canariomyces notabilis]|uniref:Acid protease n=1 Tax=Canariomyces notabilis TaxID=2074819 RepID=A0AAN6QD15_9PEZI|nr:acid protease [Canariomyces arenarius]
MLPLIFAAPLIGAASVAASERRQLVTRGDGFIRSPVNALPGPAPRLRVRQNEIEVDNQLSGTRYVVDVEIGTPGQPVSLILDTGSPDTWVNPDCDNVNQVADCESHPRYDYTKSQSANVTRAGDVLVYGIGNATIRYVRETVTIGSATIENQIIGVATESHSIPLGILGMSPNPSGRNDYPYILDTMVDQGLIKSRAFSLDLRGVDNPNGALIFGGIDTGKYIGELAKLPILDRRETPRTADRYYVTMTGVGLTLPDGSVVQSETLEVPVFLDSGSTFSYLPPAIYEAFASAFNDAEYDPRTGFYYLPCDVADVDGSVDFYFGEKAIRVSLNDFIWQVQGYCILGVLPDNEEPILGDTFLRAAYVVFDQDNRNLHIAQAANCGTNLVAIGSGVDAVPSSTGECTELPTPTATGGSLDFTTSRPPASTFTGSGPTGVVIGPGPVASKVSGSTEIPGPTQTGSGSSSEAGGGARAGSAALVALAVVNMLLVWVV